MHLIVSKNYYLEPEIFSNHINFKFVAKTEINSNNKMKVYIFEKRQMRKIITFFFILIIGFSISAYSKTITVYKWTDSKGIAHFSYIMPKDAEYTTFEMKKPPPKKINSAIADTQEDQSLSDKLTEQAKTNCKNAQDNLKVLSEYAKVKFADDSGKERLLSDEDKAEYKKQAEKRIELFCTK